MLTSNFWFKISPLVFDCLKVISICVFLPQVAPQMKYVSRLDIVSWMTLSLDGVAIEDMF